jgi:hypothetical protein
MLLRVHIVTSRQRVHFSGSGPLSYTTSFLLYINLGATLFDDPLALHIATVIGNEGRTFSNGRYSRMTSGPLTSVELTIKFSIILLEEIRSMKRAGMTV